MILLWTHALVEICHTFLGIAAHANTVFLSVGLEGTIKLLVSWAGHALAAHVKVTCLTAREEILLISIDYIVANIAVEFSAVGLECPAVHSPNLWVIKVSFFQWMRIMTADSS